MRLATVAAVWNEKEMLPQFLRHYADQVDLMLFLDNESDDGSMAAAAGYPNVRVETYSSGGEYRESALTGAKEWGKALCGQEGIDWVLIVDADEFVVPAHAGCLKDALAEIPPKTEFVYARGYEMWKGPGEQAYNPAASLISQRRFGISSRLYSKPCAIRPRAERSFFHGFHDIMGTEKPLNLDGSPLLILHYVGVDEDLYVRRRTARTKRVSEENLKNGWGTEYVGDVQNVIRNLVRQGVKEAEDLLKGWGTEYVGDVEYVMREIFRRKCVKTAEVPMPR